ncbi:MAG: LacI family DNA-binding transcriptional regulator [Gaiellaceae bacterium]
MSSLRDVADHAGVSLATASRVVSGLDNVRSETRERVERAMRELLYVPPGRRPATGVVGLLVPSLENPIFPAVAQAMEERATEAGFASILCNTTAAAFREVDYVHMLLDRGADGMIFISCEMTNMSGEHDHYARLVDEGARIVFVNGALNTLHVPSVAVDERSAGELATQHLLDLGHRRIGYVAGPDYYLPTQQKAAGREAALRGAGVEPDGLVVFADDFSVEQGRVALRRLLERSPRATGVICSSDLMAIGVLQEAAAQGLRVPEDLSVVGFDGIEAAAWTSPPLTTVEQPIEEIAETAVNALQSLIADPQKPLPDYTFRPRLKVRGSTSPPS